MLAPAPAAHPATEIVTEEWPWRYRLHIMSTPVAVIDPIEGTTLDFTDAVKVMEEVPIRIPST